MTLEFRKENYRCSISFAILSKLLHKPVSLPVKHELNTIYLKGLLSEHVEELKQQSEQSKNSNMSYYYAWVCDPRNIDHLQNVIDIPYLTGLYQC